MSDDLVKRLRNPIGTSGSDFNATYWLGISSEAADRIEALEKALLPFAKAADALDREAWDNLHIEGSNADITGEHCRAARAALEGKNG